MEIAKVLEFGYGVSWIEKQEEENRLKKGVFKEKE